MKKLLIIMLLLSTMLLAGIAGGTTCNNAAAIEANQNVTLSPANNTEWQGNAQKYGYYSFTVAQNSETTISFTPMQNGGSWLGLYTNCQEMIANKWTAANTTGTISKTLQAGTYQFFINKSTSSVEDIQINIATNDDNGGEENTPITREQLIEMIANGEDVTHVDTSEITDMSYMFQNTKYFNQDISGWDVSHVTNMRGMFSYAENFNQDISGWDVSKVTDMSDMFVYAACFNRPIGSWDVSSVTTMYYMFGMAKKFNQDISQWDVSNVTSMESMFSFALVFDQDISNWDISNVTNHETFSNASPLTDVHNPFEKGTINGGKTCNNAVKIAINNDVVLRPKNYTYWQGNAQKYGYYSFTVAQNSETTISFTPMQNGDSWLGLYSNCQEMIANKWTAANTTGTISKTLQAGTYQFFINKSTSSVEDIQINIATNDDNGGEENTPITREQLIEMIANGEDVTHVDTSEITDMSNLFYVRYEDVYEEDNFKNFNQDISGWDVSKVTNMSYMFANSSFNQDISGWDVSSVTNMEGMFQGASYIGNGYEESSFNQDISNWDVSNVTNMSYMFENAFHFDQDIGNWDVSKVTNMHCMFAGGGRMVFGPSMHTPFNQDISGWDVSHVTDMSFMFYYTHFNQDIGNWDVSSVAEHKRFAAYSELRDQKNPFEKNRDPNAPISKEKLMQLIAWGEDVTHVNTSEITDMSHLFYVGYGDGYKEDNFKNFNQDISGWDVSHVTNMRGMFEFTENFNQDISGWDVSRVTDMSDMFYCAHFNQDISGWDVSNVTKHGTFSWGSTLTDAHNPFAEKTINGGKTCNDAVEIATNNDVVLRPTNDTEWKGNAQKYGYYSFTVAQNSETTISFTPMQNGDSWLGLYTNCQEMIADKWTAENTTGIITKTLQAGTYQFFINKSTSSVEDIRIRIYAH